MLAVCGDVRLELRGQGDGAETHRTVPPSIRGTPRRRQRTPKRAVVAATRRSHHAASSRPPATACPSTAAITGLLSSIRLGLNGITPCSLVLVQQTTSQRVVLYRCLEQQLTPLVPGQTCHCLTDGRAYSDPHRRKSTPLILSELPLAAEPR